MKIKMKQMLNVKFDISDHFFTGQVGYYKMNNEYISNLWKKWNLVFKLRKVILISSFHFVKLRDFHVLCG